MRGSSVTGDALRRGRAERRRVVAKATPPRGADRECRASNNGAAGSLGAGGEAAGVGTKSPAVVERKLGQDLSSTESWSALTARREALLFWGGRRGEDSRTSGNGHIVSRHGTGIKQENTRIRATE